jgi:hypothetical protein
MHKGRRSTLPDLFNILPSVVIKLLIINNLKWLVTDRYLAEKQTFALLDINDYKNVSERDIENYSCSKFILTGY